MFHQLKYHGTMDEAEYLWDNGQCFLQIYNVFWDTSGHDEHGHSHCYACDSITVLAEEVDGNTISPAERRFNHEKWGTARSDRVEDLYREKVRPSFDPRKTCTACLFMRNNREVRDLSTLCADPGVSMAQFPEHVNFP
jgi:hypothetical protein